MLDEQEYDGHTSVHDEATAARLGLRGAPIEGPTHFSQFDPLGVAVWGDAWFERGCISSHFLNMVVSGEEVQASLTTAGTPNLARIDAHKPDGTLPCSPARPRSDPTTRRPSSTSVWRPCASRASCSSSIACPSG